MAGSVFSRWNVWRGFSAQQILIVNLLHTCQPSSRQESEQSPESAGGSVKTAHSSVTGWWESGGAPPFRVGFPEKVAPEPRLQGSGEGAIPGGWAAGAETQVHGGWNHKWQLGMKWELSGQEAQQRYRRWGRGFSLFSGSKRDIVARAQVLESLKPRKETSAMGSEPEGGSEERQKQE